MILGLLDRGGFGTQALRKDGTMIYDNVRWKVLEEGETERGGQRGLFCLRAVVSTAHSRMHVSSCNTDARARRSIGGLNISARLTGALLDCAARML